MKLADCKTPALILDRSILARNTAAMAERMERHGVRLRPHMKTAKSAKVAELAAAGGAGITVSTLREAAYFAEHGFRDVTYAVSIIPEKPHDREENTPAASRAAPSWFGWGG